MPNAETVKDTENTQEATEGIPLLSSGQTIAVILLGVALWFTAAVGLRYAAPAGFLNGTAGIINFAINFPVIWLLVQATKRLFKLSPGQVAPGFAVGTAAAAFCDGAALIYYPTLYGSNAEDIVLCAGAILWGAAVGLALAYLDDYRSLRRKG